MHWLRPKSISFDEAKRVLIEILRDVGCEYWADRVSESNQYTFNFFLGGMGSLCDLVILAGNGDKVSAEREPIANTLLTYMLEICYAASKPGILREEEAIACCGGQDQRLSGWRCKSCGYLATSVGDVGSLAAAIEVRKAIQRGIGKRLPAEALLELWRSPGALQLIPEIMAKVQLSGIHCLNSSDRTGACPACGSEAFGYYRWILGAVRFSDEGDNPSMQPPDAQK